MIASEFGSVDSGKLEGRQNCIITKTTMLTETTSRSVVRPRKPCEGFHKTPLSYTATAQYAFAVI
jgi:hypothetical protein